MISAFEDIGWAEVKEIFLDILFPRFCFGCGREGTYICSDCELFLTENNLICPVCGETGYFGKTHDDCSTKSLDGLISIWDYEGTIRKTILSIKGRDSYHVAEKLIERAFANIILEQERFIYFLEFFLENDSKITFVPAHKKKKEIKIEAGFRQFDDKNHAEEIAKCLAKVHPKERSAISLLQKIRRTEKQADLSRKERLKNVKGVFDTKKKSIPENLILVDDVFTTGATMRECAKSLKKSGAEKIWGFTLARTV